MQDGTKSDEGCFYANFKPERGNYTKDGSLITIYYAHPTPEEPSVIYQQRWTLER
jgi:hypothetical protein